MPDEPTPPPPVATVIASDDTARWYLAFTAILQFVIIVGYIIFQNIKDQANNAEMMVLGAEIGYMSTVMNYYFGSSSGSTAKSALLEKNNKP